MSLRPRYSLLTLLIITALVAGGVKRWYGPHHVVMSDPPTAEEQQLLEVPNVVEIQLNLRSVVSEYEYVNEWNTRKYRYVKSRSTVARPIPVRLKDKDSREAFLLPQLESEPEVLARDLELAKKERVVCWLYQVNYLREPHEVFSPPMSAAQVVKIFLVKHLFFLTSRRQIYRLDRQLWVAYDLQRIDLNEIDDAEFRACVARELAKIPEPE